MMRNMTIDPFETGNNKRVEVSKSRNDTTCTSLEVADAQEVLFPPSMTFVLALEWITPKSQHRYLVVLPKLSAIRRLFKSSS